MEQAVDRKAYHIIIILVGEEVFLTEKIAEGRVAQSMGLVGAKLKHSNDIGGGDIHARNLTKGC